MGNYRHYFESHHHQYHCRHRIRHQLNRYQRRSEMLTNVKKLKKKTDKLE